MDNQTRKFEAPDLDTRRMAESDDADLLCLRCGSAMVETTAYTYGVPAGHLMLVMRGSRAGLRTAPPTTSIDSFTCPRCGYTELAAHDLDKLALMIETHAKDPRIN